MKTVLLSCTQTLGICSPSFVYTKPYGGLDDENIIPPALHWGRSPVPVNWQGSVRESPTNAVISLGPCVMLILEIAKVVYKSQSHNLLLAINLHSIILIHNLTEPCRNT